MAEPLLTTDTCYHGSPKAARRKFATGIIRGTVNEGTPDARTIRIDLREASGDFERADEAPPTTKRAPPSSGEHIGAPAQYPAIGLFLWWWWWWPWWYWTWSPAITDAPLYDANGNDAGMLSGTLRIGLREREDAPEAPSASAIGCAADSKKERYSLGMVEIDVGSGSAPLRVTSVYLETPPPSVRYLPHIAAHKRKTAAEGVTWVDAIPTPGGLSAVEVSVAKENPNQHPWAGRGYATKYALRVGSDAPRQGLRLWLAAGETYVFEAPTVPSKHPFHVGTDAQGGPEAAEASRLSRAIHSGVSPPVMSYRPELGHSWWTGSAYYQCTKHRSMGGEIAIYRAAVASPMLLDDETGKVLMHDTSTGECVVVAPFGTTDEEERFATLGAAFRHIGLKVKTPAIFRLGDEISPDNPDLCCAALTREGGDDEAAASAVGSASDDIDQHAPVVLVSADGTHHCNHVHSASDLRAWLQIHKPASSRQVCPMCDP